MQIGLLLLESTEIFVNKFVRKRPAFVNKFVSTIILGMEAGFGMDAAPSEFMLF